MKPSLLNPIFPQIGLFNRGVYVIIAENRIHKHSRKLKKIKLAEMEIDIKLFLLQVWKFVQRSLILFSLGTGIFVSVSGTNFTFLRCLGREEAFRWYDKLNCLFQNFSFRYNLSDFYTPVKFHGVEFQGPFWLPRRLFPNIVNFSFVLIVPGLYGAIFRFRKKHTTAIQGWHQL